MTFHSEESCVLQYFTCYGLVFEWVKLYELFGYVVSTLQNNSGYSKRTSNIDWNRFQLFCGTF